MSPAAPLVILTFIAYFLLRAVVVVGPAMLFVARSRFAQARRVYRRTFADGQMRSELRAGLITIVFDGIHVGLLRATGSVPIGEPGVVETLLQFALLFVWFEIWFYVTHRALHLKPLYFLHAQHHVAKVTHPLTSLSFGIAERAILQSGALLLVFGVGTVWPLSLKVIVGYFLLNYVLNVVGHLNVELFPASFGRSALGRVFYSVSFHAMHHARYTGHYGLFTVVLDRAFGTAWEDYPEVQRRAAMGDGLTTLGARAPVTPAHAQARARPQADVRS